MSTVTSSNGGNVVKIMERASVGTYPVAGASAAAGGGGDTSTARSHPAAGAAGIAAVGGSTTTSSNSFDASFQPLLLVKKRLPPLLPGYRCLRPSLPSTVRMSSVVSKGLQDEWGQVRLAATTASLSFLNALKGTILYVYVYVCGSI